MKQLTPVATPPSYIDIFEGIRDKKNILARTALAVAEAAIRSRFSDYETRLAANTLQGMPDSALGGIRTELRSCYGPNVGMKALKKAIKEAQPKGRLIWCPFCGATTPGSHDHYLPAEKFPEFAAHALNLVPSCTRCNSTKDDDWLHAGARQYLHFYRDTIPVVPYLTVAITSDPVARAIAANFAVQQAGMSDASWALLETHFRKLKLIELYDSYSNDLLNSVLRSARSYINAGGPSAASFLANEAQDDANLYGDYGWRAVLLRGMSVHPHLNQWIAWL
ncbi:MAG: HNH endonuclease [Hoeflea sp.]|uniref:HNH endonuclease n=1 Tax=Hoeflea sp. TaxID=1940281 RepID=UPI003EFAED25